MQRINFKVRELSKMVFKKVIAFNVLKVGSFLVHLSI